MSYIKLSEEGYILAEASQQIYIDQMVQAYSGALGKINAQIERAYAKLAGVPADQYYSSMLQYNRLTALKDKISKLYATASRKAGKAVEHGLVVAMTENYNRQLYLGDWLVNLSPVPINENLVKYAVTGNIDFWKAIPTAQATKYGPINLYSPQTGTLKELLSANAAADLDKVLKTIVNGFLTGQSYRDQARVIRDVIGGYAKKKGVESASGSVYKALRIARTEGTRVMNSGTLATGKTIESQGIDVKKEWMATLDSRTRGRHQYLDGKRVDIAANFTDDQGATGQAPGQMSDVASNANCRCTMINVIGDRSPQTRLSVNPVTGEYEAIDYASYETWRSDNGT